MAFAETILDPIEERFGKPAAALAALTLVASPVAGIIIAIWIAT